MSERGPQPPEAQKKLGYDIGINREMLRDLPEIPEEMKDWLMRLPENLRFDEPIILIVGENGSGKTSFARAIIEARGRALQEHNPDTGKIYTLDLDPAEPASVLSSALTSSETRAGEGLNAIFIDGSEVMSEIRRWAKSQSRESGEDLVENRSGGSYTHRLSSRQLFEQAIKDLKEMQIDRNRRVVKNVDVIFDEPEQGLSPQRQLDLPENLSQFIQGGDTMLVPTNNLALFLSDLPRLDLSKPERGVHRPSEFGELGQINLHAEKTE